MSENKHLTEKTSQVAHDLHHIQEYLAIMRDFSADDGESALINKVIDIRDHLEHLQSLLNLAVDAIDYLTWSVNARQTAAMGRDPGQDPSTIEKIAWERYDEFREEYIR